MESPLKQRLIGAAVLAALAIIFLPMLLKGPDVREPDAAEVPLTMPASPGTDYETRELPLTAPETTPPGGVLGMDRARPAPVPAVPNDTAAVGAETGVLPAAEAAREPAVASDPAPVPEKVAPVSPAAVAA